MVFTFCVKLLLYGNTSQRTVLLVFGLVSIGEASAFIYLVLQKSTGSIIKAYSTTTRRWGSILMHGVRLRNILRKKSITSLFEQYIYIGGSHASIEISVYPLACFTVLFCAEMDRQLLRDVQIPIHYLHRRRWRGSFTIVSQVSHTFCAYPFSGAR